MIDELYHALEGLRTGPECWCTFPIQTPPFKRDGHHPSGMEWEERHERKCRVARMATHFFWLELGRKVSEYKEKAS